MAPSDAQKAAAARWKAQRDCITIRPTRETGAKIRAAAADSGLSLQQYVLRSIDFFQEHQDKG